MNTTKYKSMLALVPFLIAFTASPIRGADADSLQNPALKRFYSELQTVFRRHYPNVTSHLLKDKIHFEQDTRVFIMHESLMTGEWQDPFEERGPKPGGILCEIRLEKGRYEGQAVVPQTFDKRYFKVLLMAPYSPKHDTHLWVNISYPQRVSADFLKEFAEMVDHYEKYMD